MEFSLDRATELKEWKQDSGCRGLERRTSWKGKIMHQNNEHSYYDINANTKHLPELKVLKKGTRSYCLLNP